MKTIHYSLLAITTLCALPLNALDSRTMALQFIRLGGIIKVAPKIAPFVASTIKVLQAARQNRVASTPPSTTLDPLTASTLSHSGSSSALSSTIPASSVQPSSPSTLTTTSTHRPLSPQPGAPTPSKPLQQWNRADFTKFGSSLVTTACDLGGKFGPAILYTGLTVWAHSELQKKSDATTAKKPAPKATKEESEPKKAFVKLSDQD